MAWRIIRYLVDEVPQNKYYIVQNGNIHLFSFIKFIFIPRRSIRELRKIRSNFCFLFLLIIELLLKLSNS